MANLINNIRINEDGEDLKCQDIVDIKKCNITKNYLKEWIMVQVLVKCFEGL